MGGSGSSLAISADRVFDGYEFHHNATVLIAEGHVVDLRDGPAPSGVHSVRLPGHSILAPGFIDVQVNGGGGVLLNDDPTPDAVRRIAAAHRRFGTTALLPTLITDTRDAIRSAIEAVAAAIADGAPGVLGIHLEGPFLNPARKGVHRPELMGMPEAGDGELLTSLGSRGITLVTLAPERVPAGFIAELVRRGAKVCAGHTDGRAADILAGIDEGLSGFTHLYNAMSQLGSREPGAVGTALANEGVFAGIIADGHHVNDLSLRVALRAKGPDRLMLVTDAMPPVGAEAMSHFALFGRPIMVKDGQCSTQEGTLAGAALDMAAAVRHMVHRVGASLGEALAMASRTPATFLGLDASHGVLRPGARADLVALNAELEVVTTWINGVSAISPPKSAARK